MSQRYGQNRRGRPPQHHYRMSPRGPPRDQYHNYHRTTPQTGPMPHREGAYAKEHISHSMTSLLGCVVEAKLTNGTVYEGILTAVSPNLEFALEAAHDKAKSATRDNVLKQMRFKFSDIVNISAKEEANKSYGSSDIFKTDTEISQSNGSSGSRDLQPFDLDEGASVDHLDSDSTGWSVDDMFQVNKEKFAVSSTYDEEMAQYTTKLERDDTENFRQRAARAQKIAQEIESKDKTRHDVDDAGTEEELFSAVVRQEVAPPPPAETTPFRPNGGTPSINSDVESVAPPPAAATVGVNSIPKTDTSSAGGSNSGKELLSDAQPVSGDSSTGLVSDTPTLTTSEDSKSTDSAIKEVAEVKGLDVTTGSGEVTSDKTGKDESSSVVLVEEKSLPVEPKAAVETPVKKEDETVAVLSEAKEKETTIRKFKLDPNAKEFTPMSFSLPTTPTASPSPALSSSSSSARSSTSTPYLGGGGKKSSFRGGGRQPRGQHQQQTGSAYIQPEVATYIPSPSSVAQGGFVIQAQPFGLRAASVHTPPSAGQVYYTPVPQYAAGATGLIAQPGMIPHQQLVAASPKFVTEIPTQPQVIGQHYPQTSQAPQFIQHAPGQALLQPSVSQQQLVPTPQGLVSAHQPLFNVVQGNLATGTGAAAAAAAAAAGGLMGGVPFPQYHHHQALAAATAAQQGGAGGTGGVASQPLAGTQVAPSRQLFQHQSHQVGK